MSEKISEKTDLYPGNKIEPWIKVRKEFIKQHLIWTHKAIEEGAAPWQKPWQGRLG